LSRLQAAYARQLGQEIHAELQRPKLGDLGHLELQGRLPIEGQARPDPNLKLMTLVGRLDTDGLAAVGPATLKMVELAGVDCEDSIRKILTAVALGHEPLARLVEVLTDISRSKIRNPAAYFLRSANRHFPNLINGPVKPPPIAGVIHA